MPRKFNMFDKASENGAYHVGQSPAHDSAALHVCGRAHYIDDIELPGNSLHVAVGQSTVSCGQLVKLELSAVRSAEGVIDVITASDIPGENEIGAVFPGDPLLVEKQIQYHGQALFAVAARSFSAARAAVKLAKIEISESPAILTIDDAISAGSHVRPPYTMQRGDPRAALQSAPHVIEGELVVGGQDQFYLEGQISAALLNDNQHITVLSSNQNPTETQHLLAQVLGVNMATITVQTRRMGGAFGGKETQATPWACLAALFAVRTHRAVKCRLPREDDMRLTGKRHPFKHHYKVGFDQQGQLLGLEFTLAADCGFSPDLSDAIVDRAMFHCDNAYFLPAVSVTGLRLKTHTVSHTAFRGFGGPQGVILIESILEDIAQVLKLDAHVVRRINYYRSGRDVTHYGQTVEQILIPAMADQLMQSTNYSARRKEIDKFNQRNPILKKGMALTPVKFGISFTVKHLNQAGALVHIYKDGSLHLNHGGTEMGQGLMTKIRQILADVFDISLRHIHINATSTDKVPNTSPTAASSGSDLNGMAALDAGRKLKQRLLNFVVDHYQCKRVNIRFYRDQVFINDTSQSFASLVHEAYMHRVSLSATGFYKTPKIHYDRQAAKGRPFYYYANGVALSEVIIDTLSGENKLLRTDILHDAGNSINPAIDIGQIEGGFVQGLGWLTTEELHWDKSGRLNSIGPATYKIPTAVDIPEHFKVELLAESPNREATVSHSKAVGEPPLMLAISVWCALKNAIAYCSPTEASDKSGIVELRVPATPEAVLMSLNQLIRPVDT
jgi:xanthine dehydrogenase large subunit